MSDRAALEDIQQAFWRAVRYDPAPDDTLRHFRGDARMSAADRMKVYRDGYWYRQVDALASAFPRLCEQMGQERFTKLACKYIRAFPSEHAVIERLGRKMPEFVAAQLPELAGLARLEWAHILALLAPDAARVAAPGEAAPATFGSARLCFVPSLQVVLIDGVARADLEEAATASGEAIPVVVWRRDFRVRQLALAGPEADALERARHRATVDEVLSDFAADEAGVKQVFHMIRGWFARQWIEAIDTTA